MTDLDVLSHSFVEAGNPVGGRDVFVPLTVEQSGGYGVSDLDLPLSLPPNRMTL